MKFNPSASNPNRMNGQPIEQHQIINLNLEDSEAFVNAILNPPPPNEALKAAALRYKQVMNKYN
ncbi:DUF1778 domain-containing protein [Aerosakkonema funiforme]|uniref:type II toxin-antitoxin system TacA family antitoxin n=1 Tax=Aerosakkonema funiforme TaxID=1246630 RepID=UPI0035B75E49